MFCSNCGNRLTDGAKFCSECGARVAVSVIVPEPEIIPEPAVDAFPSIPVEPEVHEEPAVKAPEPVVPQMPETVVSETPMGSVEMPMEQPNAPVKTRLAFDWSNVKEESRRRPIPNVKSPWEKTGSIDENELYAEMKPSNDRSRTMNFIDLLMTEKEQAARKKEEEPKDRNIDYTQVLHLDLDDKEGTQEEQPKLSFAPLYEDTDSPVSTPFDESGFEKADTGHADLTAEKPAADPVPEAEPAPEKTAWKWYELPDFLKPKVSDAVISRQAQAAMAEKSSDEAEAETVSSEHALFEEPKYEEVTDAPEEIEEVKEEAAEAATVAEGKTEVSAEAVVEAEVSAEAVPETEINDIEELAAEPAEEITSEEPAAVDTPDEPEFESGESDYDDYLNMDIGRAAEPAVSDAEADAVAEKHSSSHDLDDDLADIIADGARTTEVSPKHAGADSVDDEEEEPETDTAVDEEELFAEMEESAPKKTGMTIAAPADKESEIEALKKRLAELTGVPEKEAEPEAAPEKTFEESESAAEAETIVEEPEPEVIEIEPEAETEDPEDAPQLTLEDLFAGEEPETHEEQEQAQSVYEPEVIELAEPEPEVIEIASPDTHEEQEKTEYDMLAEELAEADDTKIGTIASFEDELASFLADTPENMVSSPSEPEPVLSPVEPQPAAEETSELSIDELLAQQFGAIPSEPQLLDKKPSVPAAPPVELEPVVVAEPEPEQKPTDAMSLEELENDLFGDGSSVDAEAEVTKKIDKFYTLYRKNEAFQKLLNEEYNKLKTDTEPSEVQKEIAEAMGAVEEKPSRPVEDKTMYQGLDEIREIEAQKAMQSQSAPKGAPIELPADDKPAAKTPEKSAPAEVTDDAPDTKLSKKERKRAEKEQRKREKEKEREQKAAAKMDLAEDDDYDVDQGSTLLTIIAVIIAVLLVFLLAVILVLNFAPQSGLAFQINLIIENITSHFSAVDTIDGGYLL